MSYFFDIDKAARESGIGEGDLEEIKDEAKKEFPDDEMMYELHVIRAIESKVHPLSYHKKELSASV